MSKSALFALLAVFVLSLASAAPPDPLSYDKLRASAEREYAEKSFQRAHELYEEAQKLPLTDVQKRWVAFRLAETRYRVLAANPSDDRVEMNQARIALEELIAKSTEHDEIWALANETLGYYTQALDYWAGSSDIPNARRHYLDLVWKLGENNEGYNVPRNVLVNALEIAETPEEKARVRFYLARQYLRASAAADVERANELLQEIIAFGPKTEYYDDALYSYGSSLARNANTGMVVSGVSEDDPAPDYEKALEVFRRLVKEFAPSETRYHDDALKAIAEITNPTLNIVAGGTFLPDSEQEVTLSWRNVKKVSFALVSVDLAKDATFDLRNNWQDQIATNDRAPVRQWTYETNDDGRHRPGYESIHLQPRLAPGAYILTASANGQRDRQLVLVTDAHILAHSGRERLDVFVSDVNTGEPIPNARVRIWQTVNSNEVVKQDGVTNASGLVRFSNRNRSYGQNLITASTGTRQAYTQGYSYSYGRTYVNEQWRIYAFTDRPAYRPNEKVLWKIIARVRNGERWTTPAGQSLEYDITGPRNEKVSTGTLELNDFGSFSAEVPVTESMALGTYNIAFRVGTTYRGGAALFRLEEYKLPEFLVDVKTPDDKTYRLGDTIEATVEASYYFGGPVANAEVEAVIYQQPFYRYWYPWHTYDWYYPATRYYDNGTVMKRESLRTDAAGRAVVHIDTPRDGTDMTYRIEARVVDASRREVRGEGNVRVMRQRYSVITTPEHFVHRPSASVSVGFKALDANDKPVVATGTVDVIRARWKKNRYDDETILTTKLDTDAKGEATLSFTPKSAGYYIVRWTSRDGTRARDVVTSQTTIWVADKTTTDLGYNTASLDLIVDKDTLRSGDTANVMIVAPQSGRWVLFTSSGDDILDTQVVKMDGNVKLMQVPLDQRHVPNFFFTASSVFDRQVATDVAQIVVPPVEQFIHVDVKPDREQYEPRQTGNVTITTRDADGKPVSAEVALSVSDEAVTAIQADLAGDPRQFFYGEVRQNPVQLLTSLQSQQYLKIEKEDLSPDDEGVEGGVMGGVVGGVAGGTVGGYLVDGVNAPPPMPMAKSAAVSEAITVTAEAPMLDVRQRREAKDERAAANEVDQGIDVQVRSDFRSTAFWKPDIITDAGGQAVVKVQYPEALTTWRATARAASRDAMFGMASSTARTNMPLLVRLQGPRFFVAGDRVVISAVMNNNTDDALTVTPSLDVEGLTLSAGQNAPVHIAARSEERVDWTVVAEKAGTAKLRVTAKSAQYGDAMERTFPVYEHGIDKLIARSGKLRGEEALVRLDLPRERRATDLQVQVASSIAVTMLDALPYLIDYPYGCTEQTMSRFLPAAIVARTLEKLHLGRARIAGKDLDGVTAKGLARLYDFQHGDGGWGWWKDGQSDAFMTAYVVWGFAVARDGGLKVDSARVDRAAQWLSDHLVEREKQYSDQAWMLHALSAWSKSQTNASRKAFDDVWTNREKLSAYSRALLALTAQRWGSTERARILVRNLEDGAQIDKTPDSSILLKGETASETMATAHWGAHGFWWRWYEGPVETTAFVLQALMAVDPQNKLVEPTMNWLVKNRRGSRWNNTRDTAIALLAMNEYLTRSGELAGDVSYEISINGRVVATKHVTAAEVVGAPSRFPIDPSLLSDAMQEIRIRRTSGKSPLYFSAEARFVSLEEPVQAAGNEIFVRREYFRLAERPTLLKGVQIDRVPLRDNESIKSGERVEVVVTVDAKNDYDYLLFEDLKPAGLEAVELQSGQSLYATSTKSGSSAWVYQELRDRKVAMFIDHLNQGVWEMRYTLRAEVPGTFHALPLLGEAMYVPEVRANGEEIRLTVTER